MALLQSIKPGWIESSTGILTIIFGLSILFICVVLFTLVLHSIQFANVSTFDSCSDSTRSFLDQCNLREKNTRG